MSLELLGLSISFFFAGFILYARAQRTAEESVALMQPNMMAMAATTGGSPSALSLLHRKLTVAFG